MGYRAYLLCSLCLYYVHDLFILFLCLFVYNTRTLIDQIWVVVGLLLLFFTLGIYDPEGFGNKKLEIENVRSDT